jgi:hypothetical protein
MKPHLFIKIAVIFSMIILMLMSGCKFDVAEPLWDQPYTTPQSPVINQVTPDQAVGGVNLITINGENFGVSPQDTTIVYFDKISAEIVSISSTSITVRRPNLVSDTCTIKVVSNKAYLVAKKGPYKITAVQNAYGSFLDNVIMGAIAVDKNENIYVSYGDSLTARIWKVTPDGERQIFARSRRVPSDAKVGPDGRLYLICTNREIDVVDPATNTTILWHKLRTNKQLRYGDFDSNGHLFAGGMKTDLWVINPDSTSNDSKVYAQDSIFAVKVSNGFVYLSVKKGTGEQGIWRHSIGADGTLGTAELVLDLTNKIEPRLVRSISFAVNGTMYLSVSSTNSLMYINPLSGQLDIFYKTIIPSYGKQMCWGPGNYAYMITGNAASPAQQWIITRINMGTTAAP